ncbi:MAG: hypothetical protein IPJ30_16140 [Acidobacteria bacterium]|nr:hypothetical protein [Acidobacteriota bacterium]
MQKVQSLAFVNRYELRLAGATGDGNSVAGCFSSLSRGSGGTLWQWA